MSRGIGGVLVVTGVGVELLIGLPVLLLNIHFGIVSPIKSSSVLSCDDDGVVNGGAFVQENVGAGRALSIVHPVA